MDNFREKIGKLVDISKNRFNIDEHDALWELAQRGMNKVGEEYVRNRTETGWDSDGKFVDYFKDTYKVVFEGGKLAIKVITEYHDDRNDSWVNEKLLTNGREVLDIIRRFFK